MGASQKAPAELRGAILRVLRNWTVVVE